MTYKKPPLRLQPTTLWEYPSQHYGDGIQGSAQYRGATPSYAIWNIFERYTRPGDTVLDPMCGSGTTIDVAQDMGRTGIGFDLQPFRDDITLADARHLPLDDESIDCVFVDPPYSDNLKYSDDPRCIGRLNAFNPEYFDSLDQVFSECHRVLRNRRYMAVYICDYFSKKRGFVPIGAQCIQMLSHYFRLIDHICVVRHNRNLKQGSRKKAAIDGNFYLRGFNHLIVVKKEDA